MDRFSLSVLAGHDIVSSLLQSQSQTAFLGVGSVRFSVTGFEVNLRRPSIFWNILKNLFLGGQEIPEGFKIAG